MADGDVTADSQLVGAKLVVNPAVPWRRVSLSAGRPLRARFFHSNSFFILARASQESAGEHFLQCVVDDRVPIDDERSGLSVVKLLVDIEPDTRRQRTRRFIIFFVIVCSMSKNASQGSPASEERRLWRFRTSYLSGVSRALSSSQRMGVATGAPGPSLRRGCQRARVPSLMGRSDRHDAVGADWRVAALTIVLEFHSIVLVAEHARFLFLDPPRRLRTLSSSSAERAPRSSYGRSHTAGRFREAGP
jgi:hypothetical protein